MFVLDILHPLTTGSYRKYTQHDVKFEIFTHSFQGVGVCLHRHVNDVTTLTLAVSRSTSGTTSRDRCRGFISPHELNSNRGGREKARREKTKQEERVSHSLMKHDETRIGRRQVECTHI